MPNEGNMRYARVSGTAFRTREDAQNGGNDLYIEGYFSVFDSPYELWEGATEVVKPGAFSDCLGGDVRALTNHDTTLVLGRTAAGTLALREDEKGLWGEIRINRDDADAMNLYARVKRGDVDQCSFGFTIGREAFVKNPDGSVRWEIEKIGTLYEVSVCTFPAYTETGVSARKADYDAIRRRETAAWRAAMLERLAAPPTGDRGK